MENLAAVLLVLFKLLYYVLFRWPVQVQLIAIVLVLVMARVLSKHVEKLLEGLLPDVTEEAVKAVVIEQEYQAEDEDDLTGPAEAAEPDFEPETEPTLSFKEQVSKFLRVMIPELVLPALTIGLSMVGQLVLIYQGFVAGLFQEFILLLWLFLGYRLVVGLIHFTLPENYAVRYHYQLLLPIFILYVLYRGISWFVDPALLGQIVIFELFDNPVTLANILMATVGFYLWLQVAQLLTDIAFYFVTHHTGAESGAVNAVLTLVRYGLIVIGVVLVFNALQFNSTTVAAIAGGASAGLAFASREILNNFIGGTILLFEQSIRPGDTVEIGPDIGVVTAVNIRSTVVQAYDGREIIVPNSQVLTSSVVTYTKTSRNSRIRIEIGVSYDADLRQVLELLRDIPPQHEDVLEDPAANAFLSGFGESSVNFVLFAWVADPSLRYSTTHDLYFMIWDAFAEHDINIPFPQRDLHIRDMVSTDARDKKLAQQASNDRPKEKMEHELKNGI